MERSGQPILPFDLEALLEHFEQAWFSGERPDLADYFLQAPLNIQRDVLMELVKIDLEFCWIRSQTAVAGPNSHNRLPWRPRLEDYARTYPELGKVDNLPLDLIVEEFRVRVLAGDPVSPEDYRQRFPGHDKSLPGLLKQTRRQLAVDYSRPGYKAPGLEPEVSSAELLARLRATGLIGEADLLELRQKSGSGARAMARSLVQSRLLTPFQAELACAPHGVPLLIGDYVLIDRLGRGGMGVVYKARHRRMQRIVAIKVLPEELSGVDDVVKRFEREAVAAGHLLHPNIVTTFDAGEQDGRPFLVMECIDGLDLGTVVRRCGPLTPAEATACLIQATRGLAYAHSRGIIHRDIKPSNLLLDRSGTLKILDLGLARMDRYFFSEHKQAAVDEMTGTGAVMGTVDYMSPEQAANTRSADARSDIYSLGCTLYFLLTGKPVFAGDKALARILAHREQPPPSLTQANPEIDARLDAVFQQMLAKQPEERFPSTAELLLALLPFHSSEIPIESVLTRRIGEALRLDEVSTFIPGELDGTPASSTTGRQDLANATPVAANTSPAARGPEVFSPRLADTGSDPRAGGRSPAPLSRSADPADPVPRTRTLQRPGGPAEAVANRGSTVAQAEPPAGPAVETRRYSRLNFLTILLTGSLGIVTAKVWRDRSSLRTPPPPRGFQEILSALEVPLQSRNGHLNLSHTAIVDSDLDLLLRQLPELEGLDLAQTAVSDAGLAQLGSLSRIAALNLEQTGISSGAMKQIAELKSLTVLRLGGTRVDDDGLARLASLSRLKELSLSHTSTTSATLAVVAACLNLEQLELEQTEIDDGGLQSLRALKSLRVLNLTGCSRVTSEGMKSVGRCEALEHLFAGRTSVADSGIAPLQGLSSLKHLWLDHTAVGPGSLEDLARLSSLEWLSLVGTRFSHSDVNRLRQRLPGCRIAL